MRHWKLIGTALLALALMALVPPHVGPDPGGWDHATVSWALDTGPPVAAWTITDTAVITRVETMPVRTEAMMSTSLATTDTTATPQGPLTKSDEIGDLDRGRSPMGDMSAAHSGRYRPQRE